MLSVPFSSQVTEQRFSLIWRRRLPAEELVSNHRKAFSFPLYAPTDMRRASVPQLRDRMYLLS